MYTKIDELMWKDKKFKQIDISSRLLFVYLLSSQHRNVLGLYNLPKFYIQGDLGYTPERVSKGLQELFDNGFITYDEESETVLVNNFLKYNKLENANQVKGALKAITTIPKTQLFYKLVDLLDASNNKYSSQLIVGINEYLDSNGFERVTVTVPKQEEVKEEETEEVKEDVKVKYLEFVLLTNKEHLKLVTEYGPSKVDAMIQNLNNYIGSKGKKYKSHYHTLLSWERKNKSNNPKNFNEDFKENMETGAIAEAERLLRERGKI